ncbi:MAG: flap endonuclease [Verrucomicrobiales bacterium]|nr:flap endonuclease [Verrucomicrobiales bacterium]
MSNRLLLVDGHAYAYRAFHAIRSLNAPDGSPTNAIFGFIKMLQKMVGALKPSHVLVLWDAGLAVERSTALPEYKANRAPTPDALEQQFPQIESWLDAAGFPQFSEEGTEADDWIGTYARRAEAEGWTVVIASADKDFLQLVNPRIGILNPNDKSEKIWTDADVVAKTGVEPRQVADWLALVGDSVDNIPGVPGVGPKTAAELLRKYGTIEDLYTRLAEIKSESQRNALTGAADAVKRNQLMVRLQEAKTGGPELESLVPRPAVTQTLRQLYARWGFKSLLAEVGGPLEQGNLF